MPKLTPAQLEKRRAKIQEEALEAVASRGQFNFRMDGDDIKRLYQLAGNRKRPVSAMVREWVLERLAAEEANKSATPPWAQVLEDHVLTTEACVMAMALAGTRQNESDRKKLFDLIKQRLTDKQSTDIEAILVDKP